MTFLTRRLVWFVLVPSLAFNVGVIGTTGYQACREWMAAGDGDQGGCSRKHGKPGKPGGCDGSLESLENLSPEQSAALQVACKVLRQRNAEICRQLTAESEELVGLLMAADADTRAIDAQMEVVADLRNQIQFNVIDHYMQVKRMLRPEQLESFHRAVRQAVIQQGRPARPPGRPGVNDRDSAVHSPREDMR